MLRIMKYQVLSLSGQEVICREGQQYQEALAEFR